MKLYLVCEMNTNAGNIRETGDLCFITKKRVD